MNRDRSRRAAPVTVALVGAVLFLVAVVHHARELHVLDRPVGPLLAVVLDGVPALILVYAGVRLNASSLSDRTRWRVAVWGFTGAVIFVLVIGATYLVRTLEGRPLVEPVFPLLIAAEVGTLAGLIAGYYNARVRDEATRAGTTRDAFGFVNELLRHDLRNDLTIIRARAALLGEQEPSVAGETDAADIERKAEEALQRIETTRGIAETLVGDPSFEPFDLVAVCQEVADQVERTYDVTVTRDLPDVAVVRANRGVRSIVDNLLENAVEHNDADEPVVALDVTTEGDVVRVTISDNGPGMPADAKRTLCEGHADSDGGLSFVHTLVEAYGGSVAVDDVEPRGTRIDVSLPAATLDGSSESGSRADRP